MNSATAKMTSLSAAILLSLAATACGGSESNADAVDEPNADAAGESNADAASEDGHWEDQVLEAAPVADPADIPRDSGLWEAHERGTLNYGGGRTQNLFSVENPMTGDLEGFDATMARLLAKYVTGEVNLENTLVTTATREGLLANGSVDAVIFTYSALPERQELVDFSDPYFMSGQTLAVRDEDSEELTTLDDFEGRSICTTQGNSVIPILEDEGAEMVTVDASNECEQMLRQGRVDAQAQQRPILLGQADDSGFALLDVELNSSPYSIGIEKDSPDSVQFLNEWIQELVDSGIWEEVFENTLGAVDQADVNDHIPSED